jgi:non-specific serine/threonine protein kinase
MPERQSHFKALITKLRKRRLIETLAAFIGGGWLILEFVDRLLVAHYHFPDKTIDLTFITILAALVCTILWRWFRGTEKRPGNVKVEVLLVPLIILATAAIDLNPVLDIIGIPGKKLLIGILALCLGIAWIIFKSLQWAASTPDAAARKFDISKLAEIRPEKSIVVLPFADLSPQKDQEYFCDGMTEEIITDLSCCHDLLVISRSSAMTLKGSPKTAKNISKELYVRYALEGSVRKAGNDLRITAQLIDAVNDVHLWAEKYSGTLDDVFDIQEKVSRSIVRALKLKLTPEERHRISERSIDNVAAYECYLMARRDMYQYSEESMERSLQFLNRALEIYGEDTLLYATMGMVYLQLYNLGFRATEETLQKAERLLDKIVTLEPESSHRYHLMGLIERYRGHPQNAIKSFKKAADLDPNDPDALMWLGYGLSVFMGRPELGEPYLNRLIEVDPLTPWNYSVTALHYLVEGKVEPAISTLRKTVQMDPKDRVYKFWLSFSLSWNRQHEEAFDLISQIVDPNPHDHIAFLSLLLKYALQGEKCQMRQAFGGEIRDYLWNDPEGPWLMADFLALVNEKNEAITWIEHAVERGWANYPLFSKIDPFLANIRNEPRFKKLMERVKYEWEHFEA